jgi:hypothetical protein
MHVTAATEADSVRRKERQHSIQNVYCEAKGYITPGATAVAVCCTAMIV